MNHAVPTGSRKRGAAALMCLAVCLSPLLARGQETLTLEEAVRLALERNEQSLAQRENVRVADAQVIRARSFFLPAVTAAGTYTRRPFEVSRAVGDTQIVIQRFNALSGNISLNLALFSPLNIPTFSAAVSSQKSAVAAATEAKRQLSFEVSQAFLSTLSTDQLLSASRHRYEFAKQNLDAAKARYNAGLASINDVTLAELEFATAEVGVTQLEGQVQTTLLQLGYLLAAPDVVRKTLVVPEFLIQAAQADNPNPDRLAAEAQTRRLDLLSLKWTAKAQHSLAIAPYLEWLPSLSLGGRYSYTNEAGLTGRPTNWSMGMTLTWSIFDGFSRNADYKEQDALARLADLNVLSTSRQVDVQVRESLVSLANQRAALKQADVAYDVAKKNAAETAELYRQGLASALQVADANVRLFEAEVGVVSQRFGLGVAFLNLEASLGLDPFGKEPSH